MDVYPRCQHLVLRDRPISLLFAFRLIYPHDWPMQNKLVIMSEMKRRRQPGTEDLAAREQEVLFKVVAHTSPSAVAPLIVDHLVGRAM